MTRTIEEGFRDFHSRLTPTETESANASSHRESIKKCLDRYYQVDRFFRIGSFGNGTSVKGYSDVDYLAVIDPDYLSNNSSAVLQEMRGYLGARFSWTDVCVRQPAVSVRFGSGGADSHEIVPSCLAGFYRRRYAVFEIPDGSGGWMKTSPEAHNIYVRGVDSKVGRKLKPLIRFLKAWKFYNSVPLSSFYLEMRAARFAAGKPCIVYSQDLYNLFAYLEDRELPAVQDPTGVAGNIHACSTDAKFRDALAKISIARERARMARVVEREGYENTAFDWWDRVFNGHFPAWRY